MDRDDVIRMAREAGVHHINLDDDYIFALERFAALVAKHEREACAATVKDYLRVARFDERHVGLGDIRLTIGDQETLEASIRARGEQ
jgi:hypothetical protein